MTMSGPEVVGGRSAVVVTVPLPQRLQRLRRQHDPVARLGIPAHVTLLFPFVWADALRRDIWDGLARIAAAHTPFAVAFASVGSFPDILYLAPEPAAPFLALTTDLFAAFPACPPYGGEIALDDLVPHLTMAVVTGESAAGLAHEMAASLPIRAIVHRVTVIAEDGGGRWSVRWQLPLGGQSLRPV
jgi:2'-5' RNA ligase